MMPTFSSRDSGMSGALFKNKQKTTEQHPDYQGRCEINGDTYFISAWINEAKQGKMAGEKYMKLKFSPPRESEPQSPVRSSQEELDDDIPF